MSSCALAQVRGGSWAELRTIDVRERFRMPARDWRVTNEAEVTIWELPEVTGSARAAVTIH